MPSWPAQGLKFSGLQHPPSENANFALASKSSKSIDDSSKKLDFLPFCKIVVSVGDDTPSAKMTFLQLPTSRCCKIRTLARENRALRDAAPLAGLSLAVGTFERGTCQVGASSLYRSSLKYVKLERGTCRARAWRLPSLCLERVKFELGTRQVRAWSS